MQVGGVENVADVREGGGVLVEVHSMRVGEAGVQVDGAGHLMVHTENGCLVGGVGLTEDVGDLLVVGIETGGEEL